MAVRGQRAAGGRPFSGSPEAVSHDATRASYLVAASKNTEARAGHGAHADADGVGPGAADEFCPSRQGASLPKKTVLPLERQTKMAALSESASPEAAASPEAVFHDEKHASYLVAVSKNTEAIEFVLTEYMRMSGVYWGLTAMALLGRDVHKEMDGDAVVAWVLRCQHPCGGFGGGEGHDPHLLYTLSALQILALLGALDKCDGAKAAAYVAALQQGDGSFHGDEWGEVDTRFSYCALSSLAILGELWNRSPPLIDVAKAVDFVDRCRNFDGGYGAVPGAESHAGQIFCCVGALAIAKRLDLVDGTLLGWWLAERQCDSGGLNGRPEKQADVCYSWWILSSLTILGRSHWIDEAKLAAFILECQEPDGGGVADRPGNMADVFHTFFGIGGLSLLKWFDGTAYAGRPAIDPVFALPAPLVAELGLEASVCPRATASLLETWARARDEGKETPPPSP